MAKKGKIIRNGIEYSGGGSSGDIMYLTQAEYDALPDTKLSDNVEYRITDASIEAAKASNISYDNSVSGLEARTVQGAVDKLSDGLTNENSETFNFGVKDGVRGFFTNPSRADDSFVPFKSTNELYRHYHGSWGAKTTLQVDCGFKPTIAIVVSNVNNTTYQIILDFENNLMTRYANGTISTSGNSGWSFERTSNGFYVKNNYDVAVYGAVAFCY